MTRRKSMLLAGLALALGVVGLLSYKMLRPNGKKPDQTPATAQVPLDSVRKDSVEMEPDTGPETKTGYKGR